MIRIFFILCLLLSAGSLFSQANDHAEAAASLKEQARKRPRISFRLIEVMDQFRKKGAARALASAQEAGWSLEEDRLCIVIEARSVSGLSSLERALKKTHSRIHSRYRQYLKVYVPLSRLEELADLEGVLAVSEPLRPKPLLVSGEEIQLVKAPLAWTNDSRGKGMKVAVIDGGFKRLTAATQAGELPRNMVTVDFSGTGLTNDSRHGTGVAEVIHEIAPEARLYLLKIADSIDLGNAKDYCKTQGIHIINHSMGWVNSEWGDGSGIICDMANDAANSGILWVNSAGNEAERHYQAFFTDGDSDFSHDFTGTSADGEINELGSLSAGDVIQVYLCWNDTWGASVNDYDFELYRWNGSSWALVNWSYNRQSGGYPYPTESISHTVTIAGRYGMKIVKYSGAVKELQIFGFYQDLENQTASRSLMAPADASGVLAVGAVSVNQWLTGPVEDYSSRGPTQDGRVKPDITGADKNTNFTYGRFGGTSSASPCVAGCAALVWSSYTNFNSAGTRSLLEGHAADMGAPGKDNEYGYGRVQVMSEVKGLPSVPLDGGAATLSSNITFTWTKGSISNFYTAYHIQVSTNQSSILYSSYTGTNRTGLFPSARHGKTYYARAAGTNIFDLGVYSGWSDGIIRDTNAPSALPGTPEDEGLWSGTNIRFSWTKAQDPESGVSHYRIQIATNTNSGSAVFSNNSVPDTNYAHSGLSGRSYRARASAVNQVGLKSGYSPWSDGITVDNTPPSVPGIPSDEGLVSDRALLFIWTRATDGQTGIYQYRIQVATNTNAGIVFDGMTGTTNCIFQGDHNRTYFARASAQNHAGLEGPFSGWSDGILVDGLAPVSYISPDPGQIRSGPVTITLSASEANAVIYYSTGGQEPQALPAFQYAGPFILEKSSEVRFFSVDEAGNREAARSALFSIIKGPSEPAVVYNNLINRSDKSADRALFVFGRSGNYQIRAFDISGRIVEEWPLRSYAAGEILEWNGSSKGRELESSIYFIQIRSGDFDRTFKVLIVK